MIRKIDYFKLGAFIIVGTVMILAMVIILGASKYFETTFEVETYFNESVNGLSVGSPVKLRGVKVGRVEKINFVNNTYPHAKDQSSRYVYVECAISPEMFGNVSEKEFEAQTRREVKRGLRIRPTSMGLTGQLFLNIIYMDPKTNPPLPVTWTPDSPYIPSALSTLSRVEGAITSISKTLGSLKQEDLQSIISDVKSIVNTIDSFMKTEGGREAGHKFLDILDETRGILHRTNTLLNDPATARIIPETASAMAGVNKIVNGSADDVMVAVKEARQAMTNLKEASARLNRVMGDPRTSQALDKIAPTLDNIAQASTELTAAVAKVHVLMNRLNGVVAGQQSNLNSILGDTRSIMENLKELTGDAKRYPSGVIFGAPPAKSDIDQQ